jgi:hypothetical protein
MNTNRSRPSDGPGRRPKPLLKRAPWQVVLPLLVVGISGLLALPAHAQWDSETIQVRRYTVLSSTLCREEFGNLMNDGSFRALVPMTFTMAEKDRPALEAISGKVVWDDIQFNAYKSFGFIPTWVRSEQRYNLFFQNLVVVCIEGKCDPNAPAVFSTSPLPEALGDQPYTFQFEGIAGRRPYSWSIADGALPGGMALEPDGMLRGTAAFDGSHLIRVRLTDAVGRTHEKDFLLNVTRPRLANLRPYKPSGWSDSIVVATVADSKIDSRPLLSTDPLFISWGVQNSGNAPVTFAFRTSLYLNDELLHTWRTSDLPESSYATVLNHVISALRPGAHKLTLVADSQNEIEESSEFDNRYDKWIVVSDASPDGWIPPAEEVDYPELEVVHSGARKLILITHGWQKYTSESNLAWVDYMSSAILEQMEHLPASSWYVGTIKWLRHAKSISPTFALDRAGQLGRHLGEALSTQDWEHVHLIAHSAGANLIDSAATVLKAKSPGTTIHLTFLDPFEGAGKQYRAVYGRNADWAENYFSRSIDTDFLGIEYTESLLTHAYNVDVTALDSGRKLVGVYSAEHGFEVCYETFSTHSWPYVFYTKTITTDWPEAEGHGFSLSMAGGGWDYAMSALADPNLPPRHLGGAELHCEQLRSEPELASVPIDATQSTVDVSQTGIVQVFAGAEGFDLMTASPAWIKLRVSNPVAARYLQFHAYRQGSDQDGVVGIYWGQNLIGLIDLEYVEPGVLLYTFEMPPLSLEEDAILSFRLDATSDRRASLAVVAPTILATQQTQVESPRLTLTTDQNGLALGFNARLQRTYLIEESDDLKVWHPWGIALDGVEKVPITRGDVESVQKRMFRIVAGE